jgi:hypothetical protein
MATPDNRLKIATGKKGICEPHRRPRRKRTVRDGSISFPLAERSAYPI